MASFALAGDASDDDLKIDITPAAHLGVSISSLEDIISPEELAGNFDDAVVCGSTFVFYKSRCSLFPSTGPIFHRR